MIGVYLVGFICGIAVVFAGKYIIEHKNKKGGNNDQD